MHTTLCKAHAVYVAGLGDNLFLWASFCLPLHLIRLGFCPGLPQWFWDRLTSDVLVFRSVLHTFGGSISEDSLVESDGKPSQDDLSRGKEGKIYLFTKPRHSRIVWLNLQLSLLRPCWLHSQAGFPNMVAARHTWSPKVCILWAWKLFAKRLSSFLVIQQKVPE